VSTQSSIAATAASLAKSLPYGAAAAIAIKLGVSNMTVSRVLQGKVKMLTPKSEAILFEANRILSESRERLAHLTTAA